MANKIMYWLVTMLVVGVVAFAATTYAYKGDPSVKGPNYNPDVEAQLRAAIEAGDYDSWIKIRQDNNLPMQGKMFSVVNKDNFAKYAQMHKANLAGDYETALAIKAELGLGQGSMKGKNSAAGNFQKQGFESCSGNCQGAINGGCRRS